MTVARPREGEDVLEAHAREPLAVGPDLGALGVEDAEGLLAVGGGVALDVARRSASAGCEVRPDGIADAGRPVADDQHRRGGRRPGTRAACRAPPSGPGGCRARSGRRRASRAAGRPSASLRSSSPGGSTSTARAARRSALAHAPREGLARGTASRRTPKRQGRSAATRDADAGAGHDLHRARRAPESATRPPGRSASAPSRWRSMAERRAEAPGAGAEQPVGDAAPAGAHRRDAVHRRQGADAAPPPRGPRARRPG